MVKSRKKAMKDLAQSKIVNIKDYRSLRQKRDARKVVVVSGNETLVEQMKNALPQGVELKHFENRFAFEQGNNKNADWDVLFLDERELEDEAIQLCEKIKRQSKMEDVVVFILSEKSDKEKVREGFEKGCDEWVTKLDDIESVVGLIDHHLDLGF